MLDRRDPRAICALRRVIRLIVGGLAGLVSLAAPLTVGAAPLPHDGSPAGGGWPRHQQRRAGYGSGH